MNSSVSPRSYAARTAASPVAAVVLGASLDDRVVGELRALPALVAVHRVVAAADGRDPRAAPALDLGDVAGARVGVRVAAVGERVDDRVRHALGAASSISARRWSMLACTPPRETRPEQVQPCRARAPPHTRAGAPRCRAKLPSAIASSMRVRSWRTTAPAPRFRWPTSELPIWPSGSPTARPQAVSCVCGCSAQSRSKTGVSASSTALPGPGGARPQPSRMTRQTRGSGGARPLIAPRRRRSARSPSGRGSRRRPARRRRPAGTGSRPRCRASRCRRTARARARPPPSSGRRRARG